MFEYRRYRMEIFRFKTFQITSSIIFERCFYILHRNQRTEFWSVVIVLCALNVLSKKYQRREIRSTHIHMT